MTCPVCDMALIDVGPCFCGCGYWTRLPTWNGSKRVLTLTQNFFETRPARQKEFLDLIEERGRG